MWPDKRGYKHCITRLAVREATRYPGTFIGPTRKLMWMNNRTHVTNK